MSGWGWCVAWVWHLPLMNGVSVQSSLYRYFRHRKTDMQWPKLSTQEHSLGWCSRSILAPILALNRPSSLESSTYLVLKTSRCALTPSLPIVPKLTVCILPFIHSSIHLNSCALITQMKSYTNFSITTYLHSNKPL